MSNLIKYESYSLETAESETEDSEKSGNQSQFWKPPVGKTVIRVLPPLLGTRWNKAKNAPSPFRIAYQHFIRIPVQGGVKTLSFVCPRLQSQIDKLKPHACPACAKADELFASGNPADAELGKDLNAKRQVYMNIILRADEERGVLPYACGKSVHDQLLALRTENDASFCDPINGFDVTLKRVGKGMNDTKYNLFPSRENSPLHPDESVMAAWLSAAHDLDRYARLPTEEEMLKKLSGDEDDAPPRAAATRAPVGPRTPRRRTAADDAIDTDGHEVD